MANERLTTAEAEAFLRASVLWRLDTAARIPVGVAGSTYAMSHALRSMAKAWDLFTRPGWAGQVLSGDGGEWWQAYWEDVGSQVRLFDLECRECPLWPRGGLAASLDFAANECSSRADSRVLRDGAPKEFDRQYATLRAIGKEIEKHRRADSPAIWEEMLLRVAPALRGLHWEPMHESAYRDLAELADLADVLGLGNLQHVRTMTERLIAEGHAEIRDLADVMAALDAADTKARAGNSAVGGDSASAGRVTKCEAQNAVEGGELVLLEPPEGDTGGQWFVEWAGQRDQITENQARILGKLIDAKKGVRCTYASLKAYHDAKVKNEGYDRPQNSLDALPGRIQSLLDRQSKRPYSGCLLKVPGRRGVQAE